ncbi:SDR family oxidoreductase [Nocardia panacis]|uniref:SDR family oxidoreductase n=1 Tax=Nocardia panacis TaxID=2340916 RepID=A0A3A4KP21_9NOCA|nr:SDR family NAD(P)-dependent oxidoreductase [Nocardia panacis]RJO79192.1 SDR family oxidoreductase [Nocardia panacis]
MSEGYPGVVLITGAANGMGANHARALAALGVHVCLADIVDTAPLLAELQASGASVSGHVLDVSDPAAWERVIDEIRSSAGELGGLVNNAGISRRRGLAETTDADWEATLRVNLFGPFYGMRAAAPLMRDSGGGAIVNISSIAGRIGYFSPAYAASKWGLTGLSKSAAGDLARWGIRVNSVHPGLIDTPLVAGADDFIAASVRSIPAGRMGTPDEITDAVLYLLSDRSTYLNGSELTVDGGLISNGLYHRILADTAGEHA